MDVVKCVHCGGRVILKADGACPACGKSNSDALTFAALAPANGLESADVVNPYQSTSDAGPLLKLASPESGKDTKQTFSHQAASFSCYAPFALIFISFAIERIAGDQAQGRLLTLAIVAFGVILLAAGFASGVVGLIGGIRRFRLVTIVYSILGLLFNGGFIAFAMNAILTQHRGFP